MLARHLVVASLGHIVIVVGRSEAAAEAVRQGVEVSTEVKWPPGPLIASPMTALLSSESGFWFFVHQATICRQVSPCGGGGSANTRQASAWRTISASLFTASRVGPRSRSIRSRLACQLPLILLSRQ